MGVPDQAPRRRDQAPEVSYLERRAIIAEREADEAERGAQDGGALAFARLRRDDAAALRRMMVALGPHQH